MRSIPADGNRVGINVGALDGLGVAVMIKSDNGYAAMITRGCSHT